MARPVFNNEILGTHNGSNEPQYDIEHDGGVITDAKLTLKNSITQAGTPINADNMNNLYDFDNLDAISGNTVNTIFNGNGSIQENVVTGGIITATRLTEFPSSSVIRETTTIYDDSGTIVLRKTTTTTTINGSSSITEEVV